MPNDTVPAAATGLPSSRRGFLCGVAALALIAPPASAIELSPDAELLDLWRRRGRALEAAKAAGHRHDQISDATQYPEPPEAVFVQEGDREFGFTKLADHEGQERPWYVVGPPRARQKAGQLRRPQTHFVDEPFPEGHRLHGTGDVLARRVPWPEAQARADAIVAAYDGWVAEQERIYVASGIEAANAEWEELDDARAEIDGMIRDAAARTLDGVRIKAQLIQLDLDEGTTPEPALIASLVRDLLAMGGTA